MSGASIVTTLELWAQQFARTLSRDLEAVRNTNAERWSEAKDEAAPSVGGKAPSTTSSTVRRPRRLK